MVWSLPSAGKGGFGWGIAAGLIGLVVRRWRQCL
jgi:hypothetical protein